MKHAFFFSELSVTLSSFWNGGWGRELFDLVGLLFAGNMVEGLGDGAWQDAEAAERMLLDEDFRPPAGNGHHSPRYPGTVGQSSGNNPSSPQKPARPIVRTQSLPSMQRIPSQTRHGAEILLRCFPLLCARNKGWYPCKLVGLEMCQAVWSGTPRSGIGLACLLLCGSGKGKEG